MLDAGIITASYLTAYVLQFQIFARKNSGALPVQTYMSALLVIVPGYLILYAAFTLYPRSRQQAGLTAQFRAEYSWMRPMQPS